MNPEIQKKKAFTISVLKRVFRKTSHLDLFLSINNVGFEGKYRVN